MTWRTDMSEVIYKTYAPTATASEDRLAGTGTTEDTIAAVLPPGSDALIVNEGDTTICVKFNSSSTTTGQVEQTDFRIPAEGSFRWSVRKGIDDWVHVEEYSTSTGYVARVWSCGGK